MLSPNSKMINGRVWVPRFAGYENAVGEELMNDPVLQGMLTGDIGGRQGWGWNNSNVGYDEETGMGGQFPDAGPFLMPEDYEGGWLLPEGIEPYIYSYGTESSSIWDTIIPMTATAIIGSGLGAAVSQLFGGASQVGGNYGYDYGLDGQVGGNYGYDYGQSNLDTLSTTSDSFVGPQTGSIDFAGSPVTTVPDVSSFNLSSPVSSSSLPSLSQLSQVGAAAGGLGTVAAVAGVGQDGTEEVGGDYGYDYGLDAGDGTAEVGGDYGYDYGLDAGDGTAEEWATSVGQDFGLEDLVNGIKKYGGAAIDALSGSGINWSDVLKGGMGAYGSYQSNKDIADAMKYAVDMSDPFREQRPQYQQMLPDLISKQQGLLDNYGTEALTQKDNFLGEYNKFQGDYRGLFDQYQQDFTDARNQFDQGFSGQYGDFRGSLDKMFNDPNYWAQNSLLSGLNKNTMNDTSREMASRGYNMSGNEMSTIAERLQNNNAQFAGQQQQNYTNYANSMLNNYGQTGLGSLNALGQNNQSNLSNFSNTGLNALQQYGGNSQNYLNNMFNQAQGQGIQLNQVGGFAGAGFGPGYAGLAATQGGVLGAGQTKQMYGDLGTVLTSLIKGF